MAGAALAVLRIALVDLIHFSQGWVQFGYRFSNDFAPFAMILVDARHRRGAPLGGSAGSLASAAGRRVGASINAWGVYWGVALGW